MDELNQTEKIGKRGNVCSGYFYVFTKIVYQTAGVQQTITYFYGKIFKMRIEKYPFEANMLFILK